MIADKIDGGFTTVSKILVGVAIGWMACAVVHQTAKTDTAAAVLPKVEAEAGCEHWRAKVATNLALGTSLVAPSQIPKDCAKPVISVPSPEHPVP